MSASSGQELSEQALIERFFAARGPGRADVVLGIGDDAAVLRVPPGVELIVTVDAIVEGVHFLAGADADYFRELLFAIPPAEPQLDELIQGCADRPIVQLDPVEHAILRLGMYELLERREIPYRVVVNEAVELCRRFGAEDGHKFVNAVLDRAARKLRAEVR